MVLPLEWMELRKQTHISPGAKPVHRAMWPLSPADLALSGLSVMDQDGRWFPRTVGLLATALNWVCIPHTWCLLVGPQPQYRSPDHQERGASSCGNRCACGQVCMCGEHVCTSVCVENVCVHRARCGGGSLLCEPGSVCSGGPPVSQLWSVLWPHRP